MKTKRKVMAIAVFVSCFGFILNCTHKDQVLDLYQPGPNDNTSDKELLSEKTTTPPVIDGNVDAIWDDVPKLKTSAVVPDPGDNFMAGYVGNTYNVTMRSLYDNEFIYFLVEWDDKTGNFNRQPWYFNPGTKRWAQEAGEHAVNSNGQITRYAFGEDKFGVLWSINNSVANWNSSTCYASCHTGLGAPNGYARHYTTSVTEKIDMWHWKSVRDNPGMADDQFQDNTQPNGRKSDASVSGTGALDNRQSLPITGSDPVVNVNVPKYIIPGAANYYWISKSEIDGGTAKLITAVDANGVLTYSGGTIDPNTDLAFQRDGASTGSKVIPSVTTSLTEGSRGDITAKAIHANGKGWTLEMKRKLNTGDADNDVNFSSLDDQYFGIGVFNNTGHSHAIKPNLLLKFKK